MPACRGHQDGTAVVSGNLRPFLHLRSMTQLTEPPVNRGSGSSGSNATIHNHMTKASTNLDISPVVNSLNRALKTFMHSTRECAYPQLVVSCRGQKIAFSRTSLQSMGHRVCPTSI